MSDYTPTREQIADTIFDALEEGGWVSTSGHYPYKVADAVMPLLADAWDEGYSMSEKQWEHIYDGHPVPEGEICPECSAGNPYRRGKR